MATLSEIRRKKGKTAHRIRFFLNGKRRSVTLNASYSRADAEEVARAIEDYLDALRRDEYPSRRTRVLLETAPREILDKLSRAGIGASRPRVKLGEAAVEFVSTLSKSVKSSTMSSTESTFKAFVSAMDAGQEIRAMTREDASRWLDEFGKGRSPQYLRVVVSRLKRFWAWCGERGYVDDNIWEGTRVRGGKLTGRDFDVPAEWTAPILDACPTQQWRALFATYRFGGLRRNEALSLRWSDVHWDRKRFTVTSTKTERYEGKASRVVPLFKEIEEELDALFTESEEHSDLIFEGITVAKVKAMFPEIIRRAGCVAWPRLFQNLRATRENELVAQGFPAHVVGAWLGHTAAVQNKYYLRVLDSYFDDAVDPKTGPKTGPLAVNNQD